MITKFKLYESQIFEKSILTKLGVPDNIMEMIQKSFELKYVTPKKLESPTKKKIKEILKNNNVLLLMINNSIKSFRLIHYLEGKYREIVYNDKGKLSLKDYSITELIAKMNPNLYGIYIIEYNNFKKYQGLSVIDARKRKEYKEKKINEFKDYFNNVTTVSLRKIYGSKWEELVGSIREYYDKITKNVDTFKSRFDNTKRGKYGDFDEMSNVLHRLVDKISDEGTYKISRPTGWGDYGIIGSEYYKDIFNFLKTRKDFDFGEFDENKPIDKPEILIKAIDQYGVMKLSTLFGRFIMDTVLKWISDNIIHYSGTEDAMNKFNL